MRRFSCAIATVFLAAAMATAEDTDRLAWESWTKRIRIGLDVRGYGQALSQRNNDNTLPVLEKSIGRGFGNINIWGHITDGLDIYTSIYITSRQHAEMYGQEGYMLLTKTPPYIQELDLPFVDWFFDHLDVKAGHFGIDFGDAHLYRTDNADAQRNPLIGNFVIDPNTTEAGIEFSTTPGRIGGVFGVTNGSENERFTSDQGLGLHGKVYGYPRESLRISGSVYSVDHSGPVTSGNAFSSLFSGNRSGGPYAAVIPGGRGPGQVEIGAGEEVFAWQADATLDLGRCIARGHYGMKYDRDNNGAAFGTPRDDWRYFSGEVQYFLKPERLYLAGRYSGARADIVNGASSNGRIDRYQIGGGLWLAKGILAKVEYVDQRFRDFAAGTTVNGIAVAKDPEFNGASVEFSANF